MWKGPRAWHWYEHLYDVFTQDESFTKTTHIGMIAMSARWPAGSEEWFGYKRSKKWRLNWVVYINWVYGRSNDWNGGASKSSMTLPCWRCFGWPDNFLVASLPSCKMRQKRGVEGRSKRGAPSEIARESEVVSVTSKVLIDSNGRLVLEAIDTSLIDSII